MASIEKYSTAGGETRWLVRYRKPDHTSTKRRGFKRKRDAEVWMAAHVTVAKASNTFIDPTRAKATIGDLSGAWLAKKKTTSKPSYYKTLEIAYDTHIKPQWGNVPVKDVCRENIQEWITGMANPEDKGKKPKSASVVLRAYGILKGILDDAVADRRLNANPCRNISLPRRKRKAHTYLTAAQLYALAGACDPERGTLVLLLGLTGLRWGEAIGLTVSDVDFDRCRITVGRSATQIGSTFAVGTTKTEKARNVIFPRRVAPRLRAQAAKKQPEDLLFPGPDGKYLKHVKNPGKKGNWFNKACRTVGIPPMTVHDLRHTAASLMVHAGANVKAIQHQLGHATASMTLDVYADLFDDDLDLVAKAMNELLLRESVPKMCPDGVDRAA